MGFFRQEYWKGLQCHPSGNLPKPGIKLTSLTSLALAGGFFTTSTTGLWWPVGNKSEITTFPSLSSINFLGSQNLGKYFTYSTTCWSWKDTAQHWHMKERHWEKYLGKDLRLPSSHPLLDVPLDQLINWEALCIPTFLNDRIWGWKL